MNAPSNSPLARKLLASAPTTEYGDAINLYGFLPGSWEIDGVLHRPDGGRVEKRGEIHAGWILDGRAIQDVWHLADSFYGTTLRIYDPSQDAWHIHWHDTLKQYYPRQIGRAEGPDIVQLGRSEAGDVLRWRFTEIEPDRFHWIADVSSDEGRNWTRSSIYSPAGRLSEGETNGNAGQRHFGLGVARGRLGCDPRLRQCV